MRLSYEQVGNRGWFQTFFPLFRKNSEIFEFFGKKFGINNEANLSTRIEQYESQLKSTLETLDSRIIKYFDQNGTVNEENMSGTDVPCSILESLLAADFEYINKPLVAQFLMVCSSKCDEDEEFLIELRDTFSIGLDNTRNVSKIIQDKYLGRGFTISFRLFQSV